MNSRFERIVLILCFAILIPLGAFAAQPPIPDVITSESHADWIAADAIVQPDGKVNRHRHPETQVLPEFLQQVRVMREADPRPRRQPQSVASEQPCDYHAAVIPDRFPAGAETTSWEQIAAIAAESGFVMGEVTASRVGMLATEPFTLIQIRVVKANRSYPSWIYLLYPRAKLTLENVRLCTTMPGYPDVPKRGSRILLVAPQQYDDAGTSFLVRDDRLFIQENGIVWLPDALREVSEGDLGIKCLTDVERRICM